MLEVQSCKAEKLEQDTEFRFPGATLRQPDIRELFFSTYHQKSSTVPNVYTGRIVLPHACPFRV
jgi:hypothetical protein